MNIQPLTEQLSVTPQIAVDDIDQLVKLGFRSIICNRPDAEEADQPSFDAIESAAQEAGLSVYHQPVISGQVTDDDGARFGEVMQQLQGPVLAYCRTGTRCTILWALSQAGQRPASEILETAQQAGYDLSSLQPRLEGK